MYQGEASQVPIRMNLFYDLVQLFYVISYCPILFGQ